MFYQLFYDKENAEIKISPLSKGFKKFDSTLNKISKLAEDEVWNYNSFYTFANNRNVLKLKAQEIKEKWLAEAESRLNAVKNIKI